MQFRHVRSFSLAVRFPRAKTPKVRGAINALSLDFPSATYIKDSAQLLQKLKAIKQLPKNCWLFAADAKSMYKY